MQVLLIDNFKVDFRTPSISVGANSEITKSVIKVNADGTAKVELDVRYHGMWAATSRSRFKYVLPDEEERFMEQGISQMGYKGKGVIK